VTTDGVRDTVPRAGTVTIAGAPNVGKSTLLNALVGSKLAIVTPRPQTTRNRIVGIKTLTDLQCVFVDTPGIDETRGTLSGRLVAIARRAITEADLVLLVLDARRAVQSNDREIASGLRGAKRPTVVVLNKMDLVRRAELLPLMEAMGTLVPEGDIVPVSALTGENLDTLFGVVQRLLPVGMPMWPAAQVTDQTDRFLAQERIREQVFRQTHAEVPYGTAVVVEELAERPPTRDRPLLYVRATVLVARRSHKPIIIGAHGQRLKEVGRLARLELEDLFKKRVFLELHVKVDEEWENDPTVLRDIGL
jgi:GTP-binding protein Era